MKEAVLDVIVVGAGFAGLSASYHLKKYGLNHLVFERGKIGESWRWSTGFNTDHRYIGLTVFDEKGKLLHHDGVSVIPGLYFLGHPWMRSRKSTILFGILEDAAFIAGKVFVGALKRYSLKYHGN
jgi:cation diffusion facilitator CzcD-associated flavoprotein CzcO